MNRLPIRFRLSLGFALVMAVLFGLVGTLVYSQLKDSLDDTIDRELSARLAGAIAIVRDDGDDLGDPVRDPLNRIDPGGFVQVLDPEGRVASATNEALAERPLLEAGALPGGDELDPETGAVPARDIHVPELEGDLRIAVASARDDGVDYLVIAGASLDQRDETLSDLSRLLWIGGPILLLLTSIAGYLVAAMALRPVDRMRERAAWVSDTSIGERLPVPPARDEISRLGETLNEMLDRIEAAFERERGFVADASHELRTPLAVLRAELDLAMAEGRSPEEMTRAIGSALEETDRLIALAEDLLVLARSDSGGLPLDPVDLDLRTAVGAVISRLDKVGAAEGIKIRSDGVEAAALRADPARFDQALSNLIENGLAHAKSELRVETKTIAGAVEVHVLDDGPGFSDELLGSALERFVRQSPGRDRSGTGLGLAIAAAIAEAHGGEVGLRNRPEGGADVWLRLPL